jgi:3'(2'), 5'-bisphosphate nucleotidase
MKTSFELVEKLIPLAEEAGKAILTVYHGQVSHTLKKDLSPLTEADKASHRIIVEGLSRIAPETPIMSEEGEVIPFSERKNWEYYFLIDPLDGTKEFLEKRPEFTVNIALIHQNRPIQGVIHLPTEGVTYVASKGEGAFKLNGTRKRLPLQKNADAEVKMVVSRRDSTESLRHLLSGIPRFEIQHMGSSAKFCLVAEGSSDFYPRMKPSMEWDTAAGAIIVEEAGGAVYESNGNPILYNRENLLNPPFYVLSASFTEKVRDWKKLLFPALQSY